MTVSLVQKVAGSGGTNTVTLPGVGSGSLLVAEVRVGAIGATVSVSDSVNGAWTFAASQAQTVDGHTCYVFFYPRSASGSPVITLATSAGTTRFDASEWSGAAASPLGAVSSAQGNINIDSGSVLAETGDLLFGAFTCDGNVDPGNWDSPGGTTAGGAWAFLQFYNSTAHQLGSQYVIATANGLFSSFPLASAFNNVTSVIVRFIAASVPQPTDVPIPMLGGAATW